MKISDRELREHCRAFNNDTFPTSCVAELLQRRAEVRRLRSVLRDLDRRLLNPPQVDLAREKIAVALAPKRKRRAK